tara:strand:+ start:1735 stop:1932 length:198 start_codon:yes stop_codon:yes gene_type:complete
MFRYDQGGEIIEVIVRDGSGAKIESHKFRVADKQKAGMVISTLRKKYGLFVGKEKDLTWLDKADW